jgi:hypothetical protein
MGIIMAAVAAFKRQATVCVCALHLTRDCMKGARQENGASKYTDSSDMIGHLNSLNISAYPMMEDIP